MMAWNPDGEGLCPVTCIQQTSRSAKLLQNNSHASMITHARGMPNSQHEAQLRTIRAVYAESYPAGKEPCSTVSAHPRIGRPAGRPYSP